MKAEQFPRGFGRLEEVLCYSVRPLMCTGFGNYQPQWRYRAGVGCGIIFAVSFLSTFFIGRHAEVFMVQEFG